MAKPRPMRTTSIKIKVPNEYEFLSKQFTLIRYVIPERLKSNSKRYQTIYADFRDTVSHPHLVFSHDEIDETEVDAVYVLYPVDEKPIPITYTRIEDGTMQPQSIEFQELVDNCGFHVLIKLLMAAYFDQPNQEMFVGRQGKNYIVAKSWSSKKKGKQTHVCLELKLKGELEPKEDWQEFRILNTAARFVEISNPVLATKRRFGGLYGFVPSTTGKDQYMRQLRRSELGNHKGEVYEQEGWDKHPTQLSHHNLQKLPESRGYIVHEFQDDFLEFLADIGIKGDYVFREFMPFDTKSVKDKLPFEKMRGICVCDVRHNQDDIPIEYYIELIKTLPYEVKGKEIISTFGGILDFQTVDENDLNTEIPVLLIQDAAPKDYKRGGVLHSPSFPDPYQRIYNNTEYRLTPKQFVNVNPNSQLEDEERPKDIEEYLTYQKLILDKTVEIQLSVALSQLYLKMLVINDIDVSGHLYGFEPDEQPLFEGYGFIRKKTYTNKGNFATLIYIENGKLVFENLQSPKGKLALKEKFNLLLKDVTKKIDVRHKKEFDEELDVGATRSYDVIISKDGLIVEIENINETVLPDYLEIAKRQKEWNKARPVSEFKLAKRYKDKDVTPEIYDEILEYDKVLSRIGYEGDDMISWGKLKKDHKERIQKVISVSRLQRLYSGVGLFKGGRTKDLKVGEGIWFSKADLTYFVGSAKPERSELHSANLLRRFCILGDNQNFDMELFIGTMAVQFVKHNDFIVLPYFFNLIDIHVENVRYWESD